MEMEKLEIGENTNKKDDGNKSQSKPGNRRDRNRDRKKSRKKLNDPSWYVPTDQNIKDVASFSMNYPLGGEVSDLQCGEGNKNKITEGYAFPGIMTLELVPTVGVSQDQTSAVNLAANSIYNEIRRANSGAKVYDAVDCMQYIIAVASLYSAMSWAQRLYGLANVYSSSNLYLPEAMLRASNIDVADFMFNLNDFRANLNRLSLSINTFAVPDNMPIFKRWWMVYESAYMDSDTAKAQTYMFIPNGFYRYVDTNTTLELSRPISSNTVHTVDDVALVGTWTSRDIINYIQSLVVGITTSEDARTISADIQKAFGTKLMTVPMIAENYSVVPQYSDEVRTQIMNCVSLNAESPEVVKATIGQNGAHSFLESSVAVESQFRPTVNWPMWLNFHSKTINPEDVMVATRLTQMTNSNPDITDSDKFNVDLVLCGSEVVSRIVVWYRTPRMGAGLASHWMSHLVTSAVLAYEGSMTSDDFNAIAYSSMFDWSPLIRLLNEDGEKVDQPLDARFYMPTYIGDVDNGFILNREALASLHATALYGEFGLPS